MSATNSRQNATLIRVALLTKTLRIMTNGDRMFLAAIVASYKRVISAECERRHLDEREYSRRAAKADRKAKEIERHFSRPRCF